MTMIPDKQGGLIDVHYRDASFKVSPFERDSVYQRFLRTFPDAQQRRGILREFPDASIRARAVEWFKREAERFDGRLSAHELMTLFSGR